MNCVAPGGRALVGRPNARRPPHGAGPAGGRSFGTAVGLRLFKEKPEFVWGLIAGMCTGNVIGVIMVLALVPVDLAEKALRQSLTMSQGSLLIVLERPISGAISAVARSLFALPVITPRWRRLQGLPAAVVPRRET